MSTILVVDDEPGIRSTIRDILEDERYKVLVAEDGLRALDLMGQNPIELVILDVWLPRMGGMDVLAEIRKTYPDIEVIVISGHANIDIAVRAVKEGAFDFLEKPLSLDKLLTVVRNALNVAVLRNENRSLKSGLPIDDEIVGTSKAMDKIREIIEQAAQADARILIMGENGTGKELVARQIHRLSARAMKPFVEVNCAAIPENLIESELFGHERGAFTDALAARKGKFEIADGGSLFLDEVADLSLSAQAKVLRAIQELKFERLGSEKSLTVDVRIIAATNKNIIEESKKGKFRQDLYFRLNVIPIILPPLRERREDIPLLVDTFLAKFDRPELGVPKHVISKEGMDFLKSCPWPGNVRELKNLIERLSVMCAEPELSADAIRSFMNESQTKKKAVDGDYAGWMGMKLTDARDEFEKNYILLKLKESGYNITKTAEVIGIYPSNLHAKIKKYGIRIDR
jgi:two-component system, NtrC family, nitrogen regulation response regulator NtrX